MVLEGRSTLLRGRGHAAPATGLPPFSAEAEAAVLAAVLLDPSAINACLLGHLTPEEFFREQNQWVYSAMLECVEQGIDITAITVALEMERAGTLDEAGGEPYLADLIGSHFTAIGVEAHIRVIMEAATQRKTIAAASQIAQLAYEGGDPTRTLTLGMSLLSGLMEPRDFGMERLGANIEVEQSGLSWGVPVLDRCTWGCRPGEMTIIAGHTGAGKSLLAGQVALNIARQNKRVAIFTIEMSNRAYEQRMASALSGVRLWRNQSDEDRAALFEGHMRIGEMPIWSSNKSRISLGEVEAASRLLHLESPISLIVVDYLQLMKLPEGRDSEATKIGQITTGLKNLARDLDCHVLLVSQFNRGLAGELRGRDSARAECLVTFEKYPIPFTEGLKGSSSIEQDADHVVAIQRHGACSDWGDGRKHAEIMLLKNRNGLTGSCLTLEDFSRCRFDFLSVPEIEKAAHGDLTVYRSLLADQNLQ